MNSENIWIAIIGALSGLGVGKIIPAIIDYFKGQNERTTESRKSDKIKIEELSDKVDDLEKKLTAEKMQLLRMQSIFSSMLPLMRKMMDDNPEHIELLNQLEKMIYSNIVSTDGENI